MVCGFLILNSERSREDMILDNLFLGVYNGELLCNTNKGGIYVVGAMNNGDCTIS